MAIRPFQYYRVSAELSDCDVVRRRDRNRASREGEHLHAEE